MPNIDRPRDEFYLNRVLGEFDRRLRALETAPRLPVSSIRGGQLLILDDDGRVVAAFGKDPNTGQTRVATMFPDGSPAMYSGVTSTGSVETQLFRDDGGLALRIGGNPNQPQFLAIYDRQGNGVVSDDTVSGQGLATPYIPGGIVARADVASWPSTTASSWLRLASIDYLTQHPRVRIRGMTYADAAGTTGQVRFTVGGAQVGPTVSVSNAVASFDFVATLGVPWQALVTLAMEGQRTAGTGTIYAVITGVWGIQS